MHQKIRSTKTSKPSYDDASQIIEGVTNDLQIWRVGIIASAIIAAGFVGSAACRATAGFIGKPFGFKELLLPGCECESGSAICTLD